MEEYKEEIWTFLNRFYPPGSAINLDSILHGGNDRITWIREWVERLSGEDPKSTVLPRRLPDGNAEWIGIGFHRRDFAEFVDSLKSFVGPSYADFLGSVPLGTEEDTYNAVEELVDDVDGLSVRFISDGGSHRGAEVRKALALMLSVFERRESRGPFNIKSTTQMIRDFGVAIAAGDRLTADKELTSLKDQARLDPVNIQFQRIRMLSELGCWNELLDSEGLSDVITSRRPTAVTRALIEAVYHCELETFEIERTPRQAINHFQSYVLPRYFTLFQARYGISTPTILKSFMLLAASSEPPKSALRDEILAIQGLAPDDARYLKELAETIGHPVVIPIGDLLERAGQLIADYDFEGALGVAEDAATGSKKALVLLNCAFELRTLRSRESFRSTWVLLAEQDQQAILATRQAQTMYEQVVLESQRENKGTSNRPIPTNWTEWLNWITKDDEWAEHEALDLAGKGAEEWNVELWCTDPLIVAEFHSNLKERIFEEDNKIREVLEKAIPILYRSLTTDPAWPRRELQGIYVSLFELLCVSTNGHQDDLALITELFAAVLQIGVEPSLYEDLLTECISLIDRFNAPSNFDWAIDYLDLIAIYPCHSEEKRAQAVQRAGIGFLNAPDRIMDLQRHLLWRICNELGYPIQQLLPQPQEDVSGQLGTSPDLTDVFSTLEGQSISIYSLNDAVNRRVRQILESFDKDIKVELSNDKVGNPRLRDLARNADVFVVVTGCAAHAATGFIEQHRDNLPTLRPTGKGSSSILKALESYANEQDRGLQGLVA